jgi:protease I
MPKNILIIIAHKDFRDEEYFIPLEIFRRSGIEVITAGSRIGTAIGVSGGEADAVLNIKDAKAEDFDAVVFVGGNGTQEYFNDPEAHRLAREFAAAGKITAAICIAPVILAKAGILKGKSAAVWSSALDKTGPEALTEGGCEVSPKAVEKSGNIITGNGREAAEEFARKIVESLKESDR